MNSKRILVTGGTGLLGQALIQKLRSLKAELTVLSRTSHQEQGYIQGDLALNLNLTTACKNQALIFHLASFNPPAHCTEPEQGQAHFDVTVKGTQYLLQAAIKNKVQRLIFVSSQRAIEATTDYGKAKRQAEALLFEAQKQIEISIVRLPALYTDELNPTIRQLYQLPPLPKMGEQRSFISVSDAIQALLLIATKQAAIGQLYQVTDGQQYSLYSIQQQIRRSLNKPEPKIVIPFWILKIMAFIGDILETLCQRQMPINHARLIKLSQSTGMEDQKIRQELGYQETTTLDQKIANSSIF